MLPDYLYDSLAYQPRANEIIILPIRMELGKVSIQMRNGFCRKRNVSGFISFSMKPDLNSRSVSNDIAQGHADKFLNPAACLIGMDHEILVTPPIPGFCIRSGKNGFKLIRSKVLKLGICLTLKLMD